MNKRLKMGIVEQAAASRLYDKLMAEKRSAKASAKAPAKLFKSGPTQAQRDAGLTKRMAAAAATGRTAKKGRGLFHSTATAKGKVK